MKSARFEVYRARDGWRWRLKAANGRVVAVGESYTRERDAIRSLNAVRTAAREAVKPILTAEMLVRGGEYLLGQHPKTTVRERV